MCRLGGRSLGGGGVSAPLRVLVCDDELMARKRIARIVSELSGIEAVLECASGEEVLAVLSREDVDVAILDIHMPGLSGLETTAKMPEERPYVVFLTAHPEHALEAFDVGAVDYVMKPADEARIERAMARARAFLDGPPRTPGEGQEAALRRLAVPTKQGVVLVSPDEISHAVFDGALVTVHAGDKRLLTDHTLQELEDRLPKATFERVHRRALLNLEAVVRLEPLPTGGYTAHVAGGSTVEVSRQSARKLRRRLGLR